MSLFFKTFNFVTLNLLQKKSFLEQKNQLQQIGINCVKAGGLN
jgi:hypothetical protein